MYLRYGFRCAAALGFSTLLWTSAAEAGLRAQPMSYDLTPSGSGTRQDVRVENTGDQPSPVEVRVERREILPDGNEKRTAAEDDFLVFPPQAILPPNGFQTFRVQYVGDATIPSTKLFVVTIAQMPVKSARQESGVEFLFNLGTLAAVSPENSKPDIVVTSVRPAMEAGKLEVTVRNEGTRYARLRNGTWAFTSPNGQSEVLEGEKLFEAVEQPLIEPDTARIVTLPVSASFLREGATAEFKLAEESK